MIAITSNPPMKLPLAHSSSFWNTFRVAPLSPAIHESVGVEVQFAHGATHELCRLTPDEARQASAMLSYWAEQAERRFRNQEQRLLYIEERTTADCTQMRLATADEIKAAQRAHEEGNCPHTCRYDEKAWLYDFRHCGTCGKLIGIV